MSDYANDGDAFVSDERIKESSFSFNQYPFTVDFEEEDEMAGTIIFQNGIRPILIKCLCYSAIYFDNSCRLQSSAKDG